MVRWIAASDAPGAALHTGRHVERLPKNVGNQWDVIDRKQGGMHREQANCIEFELFCEGWR